jgi:hypothetical protein
MCPQNLKRVKVRAGPGVVYQTTILSTSAYLGTSHVLFTYQAWYAYGRTLGICLRSLLPLPDLYADDDYW